MSTQFNYSLTHDEMGGDLDWLSERLSEREEGEPDHGATFEGVCRQIYYLACPRKADGTYAVPNCAFEPMALTFGLGLGWFEDMMISPSDAFWRRTVMAGIDPDPAERRADEWAEVQRMLNEEGTDPIEYVACFVGERAGILTYNRDPRSLTWTVAHA